MEKAFNKTYGLNLQFKYTPGPAMPQFASRIIQEAKPVSRRRADLFVGSENHVARMSLKSVDWTKTFNAYHDADDRFRQQGLDRDDAHAGFHL